MSVKAKDPKEEEGGIISLTNDNNEEIYLYSLLPKAFIMDNGLLDIAVVGTFSENVINKEGNLIVDSFIANPEFINFFHTFLEKLGRNAEGLSEQATRQEEGSWVYLIDQRVDDITAHIQSKDIIGGFKVESGKLGEYAGNPQHVLLSEQGIFQIGTQLKTKLIHLIQAQYQTN